LLLLLTPAAGAAQEGLEEEYHKNIKVYQPKPFLKKGRLQYVAYGSVSLNPRMATHYGVGGSVDYHISEYFSVGLQAAQLYPSDTTFKQEVEEKLGLFPEQSKIGFVSTARVGVTPLFGKFGTDFMPYWDASFYVGGGVIRSYVNQTTVAPTLEVGLGMRFFATRFMAFTLDVTDYVYWEQFQDGRVGLQNWMARAGLAVFIPFSFKYTEEGK